MFCFYTLFCFQLAFTPLQSYQLEPSLVKKHFVTNATKSWHMYVKGFSFFFVFNSFVSPNSEKYVGNVMVLYLQRIIKKSKIFTKTHELKGGDIVWNKQRIQLKAIKR